MKFDKNDLLLYAVTDRTWTGKQTLCEQTAAALRGGATFVQLREKELDGEELLAEALEIQELCRAYKIPFVINDNAELAAKINADGVHIGQNDTEVKKAREIIGTDKILGVSVHTVEQAVYAEKCGADYLGVGAVFPTSSKADADDVGMNMLREICRAVTIPVVAIGGICSENISMLKGSGICGVAVISAIFAAEDIEKATSELKNSTTEAVGKCR